MKIVFLDIKTIGEDLDYSKFEQLGEVTKYSFTSPSDAAEKVKDADVIVTNKVAINESTIGAAQKLKLVCVTATGTNHLDKDYLAKRNIAWRNVADYSTQSVAQHTFALLFYLLENSSFYDNYVKSEAYVNDTQFTHFSKNFHEINGMTWGIIGLGNIGRKVAEIAVCFGANVIYTSPSGAAPQEGFHQVDMDTLLSTSDIISIHAPLNEYTQDLMNAEAFKKMKPNCILLNLGRGAIVVEKDLVEALNNHQIQAAGLDVICNEPMSPDCPLLKFKDSNRLYITPHVGWASVESRTRLMDIIYGQIKDFFRYQECKARSNPQVS